MSINDILPDFGKTSQKNKEFTVFDCIEFLEKNPDIRKINSEIVPFQGILKTFDEDKKQGFSEDKKFFNL